MNFTAYCECGERATAQCQRTLWTAADATELFRTNVVKIRHGERQLELTIAELKMGYFLPDRRVNGIVSRICGVRIRFENEARAYVLPLGATLPRRRPCGRWLCDRHQRDLGLIVCAEHYPEL